MSEKNIAVQCPDCGGDGAIAIREHFVTHDMALDACEPSMEGMSMGIEYAQCPRCGGGGLLDKDDPEYAARSEGKGE